MNVLESVTVEMSKDYIEATLGCYEVIVCGSRQTDYGVEIVLSGEYEQVVNCIFDLIAGEDEPFI